MSVTDAMSRKPLTLTELARADGMVWIKAETSDREIITTFDHDFEVRIAHELYDGMPAAVCYGRGGWLWLHPATVEYLTIPESNEPRLREIEKRVNEVGQ